MTTINPKAYYCVDVKMKHGFKYTMYLRGFSVNSMRKFTDSLFWTESTTVRETTEEEFNNSTTGNISQDVEKPKAKKTKKEIGFSTVEDFFMEEKPKRTKRK